MKRKTGRWIAAAAIAPLVIALASCGSSDDSGSEGAGPGATAIFGELAAMPTEQKLTEMKEKAAEEGKVTIYSSRDEDLLEALKKGFEKLYPDVNVEYLSGENPEVFARMQQEGKGSNANVDVVLSDLGEAMKDGGLLAGNNGAVVSADYPKTAYGDNFIQLGPTLGVTAWNTDLVSEDEAPRSWDDLLDPKWKGKLALEVKPDHLLTSMVTAWGEEKTREYMTKLMANDPLIRKGNTQVVQLLAAGEFPVSISSFAHAVEEARADGAPIDWEANDPIPVGSGSIHLAEYAPHPYAAGLFVNFLTDKAGAEILKTDGRNVLTPGVEPMYPRQQELMSAPGLTMTDPFTRAKDNVIALKILDDLVTPAYSGQ